MIVRTPGLNFFILFGVVGDAPFFNLVASDNGAPAMPFLRILVHVPRTNRDGCDRLRVVAYGALAERMYAVLKPGAMVLVRGHLQARSTPKGTVMEGVAEQMMVVDTILTDDQVKRLQVKASELGMDVGELTTLLFEPQLVALESLNGKDAEDKDNGN